MCHHAQSVENSKTEGIQMINPTNPNGIDLAFMAAAAMILITLYIRVWIEGRN